MRGWRCADRILVGKYEGRNPFGRLRSIWEYKVKIGFKEMGWKGVDWIKLAQDMDK
jgi:hypothetical protein